jgi:predicted nuclease of predicted toxin-antitoxin system
MKLLLDECIPAKFKFDLSGHGHEVTTVIDAGFIGKENGELLNLAENAFDALVTVDKNLPAQQNLKGRRISIVIIRARSNRLADIRAHLHAVLVALQDLKPGQIIEIGNTLSQV